MFTSSSHRISSKTNVHNIHTLTSSLSTITNGIHLPYPLIMQIRLQHPYIKPPYQCPPTVFTHHIFIVRWRLQHHTPHRYLYTPTTSTHHLISIHYASPTSIHTSYDHHPLTSTYQRTSHYPPHSTTFILFSHASRLRQHLLHLPTPQKGLKPSQTPGKTSIIPTSSSESQAVPPSTLLTSDLLQLHFPEHFPCSLSLFYPWLLGWIIVHYTMLHCTIFMSRIFSRVP